MTGGQRRRPSRAAVFQEDKLFFFFYIPDVLHLPRVSPFSGGEIKSLFIFTAALGKDERAICLVLCVWRIPRRVGNVAETGKGEG